VCNGESCILKYSTVYYSELVGNKCLVFSRDTSEEVTFIMTVPSFTYIQIRLMIINFWIHYVMHMPVARQWLGKLIPEAYAVNNRRISIAR
jgi:hypothetical protein